jgi:hypothetical protein
MGVAARKDLHPSVFQGWTRVCTQGFHEYNSRIREHYRISTLANTAYAFALQYVMLLPVQLLQSLPRDRQLPRDAHMKMKNARYMSAALMTAHHPRQVRLRP